LQNFQALVERDARHEQTLDADGVELLESLQLARLHRRLQRRERRQRYQLAARTADVHLGELIRRQALAALDLRNDLVAAPLDAEAVDVIAAEENGEVAS